MERNSPGSHETLNEVRGVKAEAEIWTTRMLAALVNGVKGGKLYSLMDKVCRAGAL
jgi:hypothetical protein